jgi:hypothetical protein
MLVTQDTVLMVTQLGMLMVLDTQVMVLILDGLMVHLDGHILDMYQEPPQLTILLKTKQKNEQAEYD